MLTVSVPNVMARKEIHANIQLCARFLISNWTLKIECESKIGSKKGVATYFPVPRARISKWYPGKYVNCKVANLLILAPAGKKHPAASFDSNWS